MKRFVLIFVILLAPQWGWAEVVTGYESYTAWEDWARIRAGIEASLASSYDRDGENDDFSQYESPTGLIKEEIEAVVKTIQGPGIIWRFWMPHYTANKSFPVRMFFDGEATPRIDTFSDIILAGTFGDPNLFDGPLVTTCAGGQVCYEPIPFAQSLRIETENKTLPESGWSSNRHYYQYSYSTYPSGTQIDSYTGQLTSQEQQKRDAVVALFENVGEHPAGNNPSALEVVTTDSSVPGEGILTLANIAGSGVVRSLTLRFDEPNDVELNGLRLKVFYDGQTAPAIDVSVAHFFGAGRDRHLYRSLPIGTDSVDPNDGFYCYWPMPFGGSLLIQLHNTITDPIAIGRAKVEYQSKAIDKDMGYLHAVENSSTWQSGVIYHTIVSTTGRGHYVGDLLYVEQEYNSFRMLEGDDVITIDGSKTLYGTGLEDAYNGGYYYNWVAIQSGEPDGGEPIWAVRPTHGILYVYRDTSGSSGDTTRADQYRWRIADRIPFSRSLEVKVESRYSQNVAYWTSVGFWYELPEPLEDLDDDNDVDAVDLSLFLGQWLQSPCDQQNDWCGGADLDRVNGVNINDFNEFGRNWLLGTE